VTLCELDPDVAAVWTVIFGGQAEQLADRVRDFKLNPETVRAVIDSRPRSRLDRAFRTIIRNRVLHGGILAPGASLMKEGENGKGLGSRWYPETLYRRIMTIGIHKRMFGAVCLDGIGMIRANARRPDVAFFVDPPYTVAGQRLYSFHEVDHAAVFATCARVKGDVLMTYDDTEEVRALARRHQLDCALVPMKSRQHTLKDELLIGRDLSWIKLASRH